MIRVSDIHEATDTLTGGGKIARAFSAYDQPSNVGGGLPRISLAAPGIFDADAASPAVAVLYAAPSGTRTHPATLAANAAAAAGDFRTADFQDANRDGTDDRDEGRRLPIALPVGATRGRVVLALVALVVLWLVVRR